MEEQNIEVGDLVQIQDNKNKYPTKINHFVGNISGIIFYHGRIQYAIEYISEFYFDLEDFRKVNTINEE